MEFVAGLRHGKNCDKLAMVITMEKPIRKQLRLANYDYSCTGVYFITLCTKDRLPILSRVVGDDAHIVPTPIGRVAEQYLLSMPGVEKYVIMPNHIHMLVRISGGPMWASAPTGSIPSLVRSFKTLVTKAVGRSLFQRSYYHVIRNEQDYQETWRYIENNPIHWRLDQWYCE